MDLPQPLQLPIDLMGSHPVLSLTIVSCVLSATLLMGGYRPPFKLGFVRDSTESQKINQHSTMLASPPKPQAPKGDALQTLQIYHSAEQLNQWVNAIQIKKSADDSDLMDAVRQYFIGQLRFYDAHQSALESQSILRNIKSIEVKQSEINVVLRTSGKVIGETINGAIKKLSNEHSVSVTWPLHPFSTIIKESSKATTEPLVNEYAGYLASMAKTNKEASVAELEIKIHTIYMESNILWVVWRDLEKPSNSERSLVLGAWEAFDGAMTDDGQIITFKQRVFTLPKVIVEPSAVEPKAAKAHKTPKAVRDKSNNKPEKIVSLAQNAQLLELSNASNANITSKSNLH